MGDNGHIPFISVVIPVFNGEKTIGLCLNALEKSGFRDFEIIVVDDASDDGTADEVARHDCRHVRLDKRSGAAAARNAGAKDASGRALFFIDADCVVAPNTLEIAASAYRDAPDAITGGTYTPLPHDRGFFSTFQSVFINYSETKRARPDYVATHSMVVDRERFLDSGGFDEEFMPILEDVEFSHRLRESGMELKMRPDLQVQHIFNYSLMGSLRNALRKSMYWTMYSIDKGDLFSDSGTASRELKVNVANWLVCACAIIAYALGGGKAYLGIGALSVCINLIANRHFFGALARAGGAMYAAGAAAYYMMVYPVAVGAGGVIGAFRRG